jgi:hypothetical protein
MLLILGDCALSSLASLTANANKKRHIRVINGRLGFSTPEIITPLELFAEEETR